MTKLEKIEREISSLSRDEFMALADWVDEQRQAKWDSQISADSQSGKLEKLAQAALADHKAGRSRAL